MTAADDYCDFCDLPKSQCMHGRPPPPPKPAATAQRAPRRKPTAGSRTAGVATKPVHRRWTPPETIKPLIVSVLREAGGRLEAEEVFLELEILLEERFLPGDREKTPQGEPRWQHAARRARIALIDEGTMVKDRPGSWQLAE